MVCLKVNQTIYEHMNATHVVANLFPGAILQLCAKGYFHLCPRMDFFQTLHVSNSLYTNYENVFIELDSLE